MLGSEAKRIVCYGLIVFFCGIFYVSQYWSPSSYGLVLNQIGAEDVGTIFGQPRPIRSDEWGVVTPLTQATVNNNFERINKTSLYKEDLRINYGLPIFDWGMVFKPTMWGYLIMKPAYAYSLHWFAIFALFIVGYALLFSKVGFDKKQAIFLSVGLYFTGFAQFWWNEKGPIFALFPWVIWALLIRIPIIYRLFLFYWMGTSWLITNFYPPVFISLSFVGVVLILAVDRSWLAPKRLLCLAVVATGSALTVVIYLKEYLVNTAKTIYPGHRSISGGSVPWQEWWSQFFPFATFDWHYESVIGQNTSEVGVAGTALALMIICFLDYKKFTIFIHRHTEERNGVLILMAGLALMYSWMLLPLPSWVGAPLLWNQVQPERMEYAAGVTLFFIVALLGKYVGVVITWKRLIFYSVLIIMGWILLKNITLEMEFKTLRNNTNDLIVIPILFLVLWLNYKFNFEVVTALIISSAVSGATALLMFNPIQSTKNFFGEHDTRVTRAYEQEVQAPSGILAVGGTFGATLNGLGFKSVAHVTAVPALDFWHDKYPHMAEHEFLTLFNRYSHISLISGPKPVLIHGDNIGVPLSDFWPNRIIIPEADGNAAALWLQQGNSVSGELLVERLGKLIEVGLFIGNAQNSSDGSLALSLCASDQKCIRLERDLGSSIDNAFLNLKLDQPLIIDKPTTFYYQIHLDHGARPVALWTYPAVAVRPVSMFIDNHLEKNIPRFQLTYELSPQSK